MYPFRTLGIPLLVLGLIGLSTQTTSAKEGVALKSGETVELANVFWVVRCHSLVKGSIVAEVLEAPPELTVGVKPQDIVPHIEGCAKPVPGGVLTVTAAKDIKTRLEGHMTIRVKFPTVDGVRQRSFDFDVFVVP